MVQKNTIGIFSNQNWKLDTVSTNDFYKESNGQTFFNLNEKLQKKTLLFNKILYDPKCTIRRNYLNFINLRLNTLFSRKNLSKTCSCYNLVGQVPSKLEFQLLSMKTILTQ